MNKLTSEQLLELTFVSDSQLAPGAAQAAAVITTIKREQRNDGKYQPPAYQQHIELHDLAEGTSRAFTQGPADTAPRFSPDGQQLAFLSKREGDTKAQLWVMPLDGGEARRLTSFKAGISEFSWHPDSRQIALTTRGEWEDTAAGEGRARVVTRLHYKSDGGGFTPVAALQLQLLDTVTGDLTLLPVSAVSPAALAFSPDGTTLFFTAASDLTADDEWLSGLWKLQLQTKAVEQLLDDSHIIRSISVSPDGQRLALIAPAQKGDLAGPAGLWLLDGIQQDGRLALLSGDLEASSSAAGDSRYGDYPNRPAWSADGQLLYLNLNGQGRSLLASFNLEGDPPELLHAGERVVTGFTQQSGTFLFTAETPDRPGELFVLDANGEKRISNHNAAFLQQYRLAAPGLRRTLNAPVDPEQPDGEQVELEYWLLSPEEARSDAALVLQVHGGPHTNYGYGFSFEFQLLAAHGYSVVFGNPRGSSSYGADFAKTMLGRYGTVDAADVLAISRHARAHHVQQDAPMHLTGGSYGGFMTNWLVGQTQEFRSAATQRSISNFVSFYGTSDIGYRFTEYEAGGNAWADTDLLWQQSPLRHAANVVTPTLIIHSENDLRCPMEQAEQWFVALKRLGRAETRLVRFPDENHDLSRNGRPDRRIERLNELISWFEAHA